MVLVSAIAPSTVALRRPNPAPTPLLVAPAILMPPRAITVGGAVLSADEHLLLGLLDGPRPRRVCIDCAEGAASALDCAILFDPDHDGADAGSSYPSYFPPVRSGAHSLDDPELRASNVGMGKYDALGAFLRRWRIRNDAEGVELGFAQIEGIIGGLLPRGATEPGWWYVNGHADCSAPHRRAWLEAGVRRHHRTQGRASLFPQAKRALTAR